MISATRDNLGVLRRRPAADAAGFSLAEMLIMASVLIIGAAVVVPILGSGDDAVARAGARRMASDFQYAQDTAIATQKDITITFDLDSESYWLSNESGVLNHPISNTAYVTDFRVDRQLSRLDIVKASSGGLDLLFGVGTISFDPTGVPSYEGTLVLRAGGSTFNVSVSPITGTVSVAAVDE